MSLDNKLLEYRLLTNDSVVGAVSITRCSTKLAALKEKPVSIANLDSFIRELMLYKLDIDKTFRYCDIIDTKQNEEYVELESKIQERIQNVKNTINNLQYELTQNQAIRKHRVECEELASVVNKHTSKSALKRKYDQVTQDYQASKEMLANFEIEIATRSKQFDDLLQCITILQTSNDAGKDMVVDAQDGEEEDAPEEGSSERANRNSEEVRAPAASASTEDDGEGEEGTEGEEGAAVAEEGDGGATEGSVNNDTKEEDSAMVME